MNSSHSGKKILMYARAKRFVPKGIAMKKGFASSDLMTRRPGEWERGIEEVKFFG